MKYDVIIIGGGPAGLECANTFINSNLSVLIIEKNKEIGPKTCAGGLTGLDAKYNIPTELTRSFSNQKVIIKNKSYSVNLKNPLKTISRADLGQYLLSKIINVPNITILKDTIVKSINENEIDTSKGIFSYKYLIGADGSNSIVRKYLNLEPKICIGMYYEIEKITDTLIWYLNPSLIKSGYIWAFPHNNNTNIGVHFDPLYTTSQNARLALENFITSQNHEYSANNFHAAPLNYAYEGCVFKNIYLIGDAAGLASKTTGEGISFALTSGSEIAKKILNPGYKMQELNKILKYKKRHENILKVFELFPFMQTRFFRIFVNLMKNKWFQAYFGS